MKRKVSVYKDYKKNEIDCEGIFHSFGVNYAEFDNGPGNYSIAIIELSDGTIVTPPADLIKFIDTNTKEFKNEKKNN